MGRPLINKTGERFGMLVVLEMVRKNNRTFCRCKCDCGNLTTVRIDSIKPNGETVSCGCYAKTTNAGITSRSFKHGQSHTPIYRHWDAMKKRCHNPKYESYHRYGGRGIKICDEWKKDFNSFYTWAIRNGYKKGLSLERIDFNGDYEPSNCKWATIKEQANNTSRNVFAEINGISLTLTQWAEKENLVPSTVMGRYKRGWRGKKLIEPVKQRIHKSTPR